MTTSPPNARDSTPPPVPKVRDGGAAPDEGVVFLCVEGAPRSACRTEAGADGSLVFCTEVAGVVTEAKPDELVLRSEGRAVSVRHLLPSAVDLAPLVGHAIRARVEQRYPCSGRATIDAQLHDHSGNLLLWARDGRRPEDREAPGLVLRAAVDRDGRARLALGGAAGVVTLTPPAQARIETSTGSYQALALRVGLDDVSIVILRS